MRISSSGFKIGVCVAYLIAPPGMHMQTINCPACHWLVSCAHLLKLVLLQGHPVLKPAQLPFYKGGRKQSAFEYDVHETISRK